MIKNINQKNAQEVPLQYFTNLRVKSKLSETNTRNDVNFEKSPKFQTKKAYNLNSEK